MPEPRAEIGELWRQIHKEMHDHFRQAFRGNDIPFAAMMILRHVHMNPGVTVSELARRSGNVKSHISKMIEQLERQGFVEKRQDPSDQRLIRIYPTQTATDLRAAMEERAQALWAEIMEEVPDAQVGEVAHGLRILLAALEMSNRKEK